MIPTLRSRILKGSSGCAIRACAFVAVLGSAFGCSKPETTSEEPVEYSANLAELAHAVAKGDSIEMHDKMPVLDSLLSLATTKSDSAEIYYSMVYVYHDLQKFDQSVPCWDFILSYVQKADSDYCARAYTELGAMYYYQTNFKEAFRHMRSALAYTSEKDTYQLSNRNCNISTLHLNIENFDTALVYARKAEEYARMIHDTTDLSVAIQFNIGMAYLDLFLPEKAKPYLLENYRYYRGKKSFDEALALHNLGLVYERLEQLDSAIYVYRQALNLALELELYETAAVAAYAMSHSFYVAGQHDSAWQLCSDSRTYTLKAREFESNSEVLDLEMKYNALKRDSEFHDLTYDHQITSQQRNFAVISGLFLLALTGLGWQSYQNKMRKQQNQHEKEVAAVQHQVEVSSLHASLMSQEKERKRIAMELHDGVGVLLNTTRLALSRVERNQADPETKTSLQLAQEQLETASQDIRRVSQNMMPSVLMKLGLCDAIEDQLELLSESTSKRTEFARDPQIERLREDLELTLFRITQELLNNALKHSQCTSIRISLELNGDAIRYVYSDDGIGFEESKLSFRTTGLESIRSRVRFIDGTLDLETSQGNGLKIKIEAPINAKAHA